MWNRHSRLFANFLTASQRAVANSDILLDHGESDERRDILDPFPEIAERRATVNTVLVGENVPQNFPGIN